MSLKARPFKTLINDSEVEGFIDSDSFVFRFYGLVAYRVPILRFGEDDHGDFAIIEETEISDSDGFAFALTKEYDAELECEWGYQVSLKRNDASEQDIFNNLLKLKGVDPNSVNLIIPPRQSISIYFNPRGIQDGSAQLNPVEGGSEAKNHEVSLIIDKVRSSAAKRVLFLSHAVRQMSRPERMITTIEVRNVVATGELIEDYPTDPRGPSCLILGYGDGGRPIHVDCSPKPGFLAIITAYLPTVSEWSDNFRLRLRR